MYNLTDLNFSEKMIFNYHNILRCPNDKIGVYIFRRKNFILYIGRTTEQSIKDRLSNHMNDCHNQCLKNWILSSLELNFNFYLLSKKSSIIELEENLIRKYNPSCNVR